LERAIVSFAISFTYIKYKQGREKVHDFWGFPTPSLAAVNWHAAAMCFSGVFFGIPKFMVRSSRAVMRDLIL
jgi:hypothetical protein